MNKLLLLISIILLVGCTQQSSDLINNNQTIIEQSKIYSLSNPVVNFTKEDIDYLGINCNGSNSEIADCILSWEAENIDYCYPGDARVDCTDPMRFNYMLPGIYPTNEIIREKRDNKIYGVCFTYAGIYCSIAKYYGLDCRLMNSLTKPSDRIGSTQGITGMSPTEYERLKVKMNEKGYDYSYDLMRSIAEETAEHYWAEVYIDGAWVVKDASTIVTGFEDTIERYKAIDDYEITNWDSRNPNTKIDSFKIFGANNEQPIINIQELPQSDYEPDFENYVGVTDDLGQVKRAANINDYFKGLGLAPYYYSCNDTCNFFQGSIPRCLNECEIEFYNCYKYCSNSDFYKVCDFICATEQDLNNCYKMCSGEDLNLNCYLTC